MKILLQLLLFIVLIPMMVHETYAEPAVIGWIERIRISDHLLDLEAKIDTGADFTSLHIDKYELLYKNGAKWVRFSVTDRHGKHVVLERKLLKLTKIKRKLLPAERRPVIMMFVCVGGVGKDVSVSLVNRENFKYKILIGRDFLKGTFLVDPGAKYLVEPACDLSFRKH